MSLKTTFVRCHLPLFSTVVLFLSCLVNSEAMAQGFTFDLGETTVDISSKTGVASASFTIAIENSTDAPLDIAGYTLFLDIGPDGPGLPAGVSFDTANGVNDAVTYITGNGTVPLTSAAQETPGATINLTPAAGDLGLGQLQFSNASLAAGASADLLTVNLLIDRSTAVAGDFEIFLNPNGQNVVVTASNNQQPFEFTAGTLSIEDSPQFPLGDINRNGVVDFLDIGPFISVLTASGFQLEADINQDQLVNFLDIAPFISLLTSQ